MADALADTEKALLGDERPTGGRRGCSLRISSRCQFSILRILTFLWVLAMLLALALLSLTGASLAAPWKATSLDPFPRRLFFRNGRFKIAVFSDLHYGERGANNSWVQWGVNQDTKSTAVMERCLADEKPDFAVFLGDQITGENQLWENSTLFLDQVFAPVMSRRIPFATIYGNHDESYNISHVASYAREKLIAGKLSWTQATLSAGDPKGVFNYYVPVYADHDSRVPALLLWFFDSRSGVFNSGQFGVDKEELWMAQDWVDPGAANWLNATAEVMRKKWKTLPPSLVFVHIPPTAAGVIARTAVVPHPEDHPGIDFDEPIDTQGQRAGFWHHDAPDAPFWNAVTGTLGGDGGDGLLAVVSGHDHGNTWCARSPDVGPYSFCFARHTGYGGYGSWARGSRVFRADLHAGLDMFSWLRMEDGSTANTTTLAQAGRTVLVNSRNPAPK